MKAIYYYSLLAFLLLNGYLISSCNAKKTYEANSYQEGGLKELVTADSVGHRIIYSFYQNGNVKEIHKFNDKQQYSGEQLWFYSDGLLDRKAIYTNGEANGNGYYFYDTTGTLEAHRYYRDDKQVFCGSDYWEDSISIVKYIIYYANGQAYYQKNFDTNGNFIGEVGKK